MAKLDEHPTVIHHRGRPKAPTPQGLDAEWLRKVCLDAGADDVCPWRWTAPEGLERPADGDPVRLPGDADPCEPRRTSRDDFRGKRSAASEGPTLARSGPSSSG